MRRTWIGAAAAASLTTVAATGWAGAQEKQAQPSTGQAQEPKTPENQPAMSGGAASGERRGGGNVQAMGKAHISQESASRIADALMATATPQNVNIDVSVGGLLPGEVDVRPLPSSVIELVPEYRGFEYVVVRDEVYIVQPSTRRVVETIREGETQAMEAPSRINLTETQQRLLFDSVRRAHLPEAHVTLEIRDGGMVPADVALEPVPQTVVAEIPIIERYRLFIADDRVVLVDPDTREVVDVVR
jgi:Protein of unknown function (DUF1236)